MRRLLTEMGVQPCSAYQATYHEGPRPIECSHIHVFRKSDLGFRTCRAEALKGRERLTIFANSFLLPSGKPTRRWLRSWRFPTEVNISVEGHFEHEGIRPGEESE